MRVISGAWSMRSRGSSRETEQPVEVYDATLEAIGAALGWRLGAVWEVDPTDGRLRCVAHLARRRARRRVRGAERGADAGARRGAARPRARHAASRRGSSTRPRTRTSRARRRRGAAACTPASASRCAPRAASSGVMEFFAGELREPDERLLATMDALGSQIGQFVARRRPRRRCARASRGCGPCSRRPSTPW